MLIKKDRLYLVRISWFSKHLRKLNSREICRLMMGSKMMIKDLMMLMKVDTLTLKVLKWMSKETRCSTLTIRKESDWTINNCNSYLMISKTIWRMKSCTSVFIQIQIDKLVMIYHLQCCHTVMVLVRLRIYWLLVQRTKSLEEKRRNNLRSKRDCSRRNLNNRSKSRRTIISRIVVR